MPHSVTDAMVGRMLRLLTHDHEDLGAMGRLLKTPACTAAIRATSRCRMLQALWVTCSAWHQPAHKLLATFQGVAVPATDVCSTSTS